MKNKKHLQPPLPLSVEISGRRDALISGCTGIIHFSKEKIAVRAKRTSVWVEGGELIMSWAGDGKIMIRGRIDDVSFKGEQ